MGIFSTNRYSSLGTDVTLEAAEGYNGEIGAALAMIESCQNDMAIFNGIIASDFQAAAAVNEGASSEEVYILQEASLKGAWAKLKEFFKKLGEKIKGIFHAFIAKMDSVFMKDSAALYKKYEKDIRLKTKWEDFTVKCRAPKTAGKYSLTFSEQNSFDIKYFASADAAAKALEDFDAEEEYGKAVSANIADMPANVTAADFEKEYYDKLFDDVDDVSFTGDTVLNGWVGGILKDKKGLKELQDANNKIEKQIKTIIANIDKLEADAGKTDAGKSGSTVNLKLAGSVSGNEKSSAEGPAYRGVNGDSADAEVIKGVGRIQKTYQYASKKANILNDVFTKYASVSVKAYKEVCATARKVFAAAVAWSPKAEATLIAAVADSAFYEAVDMIDTMYDIAD